MQSFFPGNLKKKIISQTGDIRQHLWGLALEVRGIILTMHCQIWTGLLFWKSRHVLGDTDG